MTFSQPIPTSNQKPSLIFYEARNKNSHELKATL